MTRFIRKTIVLAKIETTAGTDSVPVGATDAILISNATFETSYNNVDRNLIRGYFGGSEQLAGSRCVKINFECEISGSGTAATAPAWGKLLQGCAFAEVTGATFTTYTPITDTLKTLTIKYYLDGMLHTALGCMGTVELSMGEGERPLYKFTFTGIEGGNSATSNPTPTLTAWKAPTVITDPNTGDIKLGSSYATGAITGGTAYASRGLSINVANDVKFMAMLGSQYISITNRAPTGQIQIELNVADEVAMLTAINANTTTTFSFEHGTSAGYKVAVYCPVVQRINPKNVDYQGVAQLGMDLRLLPSAGNDEMIIITS